jgi:hypothetical protein
MIRALEIPGLQQTTVRDPDVSPAAAAAPAAALGSVASAIGGVSDAFAAVADRIQRTENARAESETRNSWMLGWSDIQLQLQKESDPAKHITLTRDWLQQQRGTLDAPDLAPVVRDRLLIQYDDFASRATAAAAEGAAGLATKRAGLALQNEIDAAERSGNTAQLDRALGTARENGILLPEQEEKIRNDFAHTKRRNDTLTEAATDPAGYLERYKDKPPEGINELEHLDQIATARRALAAETAATSDQILDGIVTGNITDPKQIDELTPGMRPVARDSLKRHLADRGDAQTRALKASPAYQASTVAKVEEMLRAWTVETDGFDEAYVEMSRMVRDLPIGAVRDELNRRLAATREGQVAAMETSADFLRADLDELTRQGAFGDPAATSRRPVTDFIRAGILRDAVKLEKTGIPAETARKIAKMEDPREQVAALKEAHAEATKEGGFLDTNEEFDRKVFDALIKGEGYLEAVDIAGREKARRAAGSAKTKLEEWLRAHPTATDEQGREALLRITGQTIVPGAVESILSRPPEFDGQVLPPKPED